MIWRQMPAVPVHSVKVTAVLHFFARDQPEYCWRYKCAGTAGTSLQIIWDYRCLLQSAQADLIPRQKSFSICQVCCLNSNAPDAGQTGELETQLSLIKRLNTPPLHPDLVPFNSQKWPWICTKCTLDMRYRSRVYSHTSNMLTMTTHWTHVANIQCLKSF